MNGIAKANEILKEFPYPFNVSLKFEQTWEGKIAPLDPFLECLPKNIRIILRQPFFYTGSESRSAWIDGKSTFHSIEPRTEFQVTSMWVDELGVLIVSCGDRTFRCLPGIAYGWGIYVGNKELLQHYGWEEGIEWDDQLKLHW